MADIVMNELVSIIIPVYNVEKYVAQCLKSVINQTYSNLEIVVVNNMSTDRSWEIVKEIASTDERIVLAECNEQGLSQTRNVGLELFKGEWVSFVDSDDLLEEHAIENMLRRARETGADVVFGPIALIDGEGNFIKKYGVKEYFTENKEDWFIFSLTQFVNRSSVCGRLYKRFLLEGRRFIPSLYGEDYPFLYDLLDDVHAYASFPQYVYQYRENAGSLTKVSGVKKQLEGAIATYDIAVKYEKYPKALPYFYGCTFKVLMYLLGSMYAYRKEDKENWTKACELTKEVIHKCRTDDFPSKVVATLFCIVPHFTCWLLHKYYDMTYGKWSGQKK